MSYRSVVAVLFAFALSMVAATPASAQSADLLVTKSGPTTASAGDDVAYTVTVTNLGPDPAANVMLSDPIPAGMTFSQATQNSGPAFSCSTPAVGDPGTVSCSAQTLLPNDPATFTFTFHIPSDTAPGTTFTNIASVSSDTFDPGDENNQASASTTVPVVNADLGITKDGPASAAPNSDVTYTITLMNNGPNAATNAAFSDPLPGTMTFVTLTQNSGPVFSCTTPAGGAGGTIDCSVATLLPGASAIFTLVGHIPPGTSSGTVFTNGASVSSETADPNEENNTASTTLTVSSANVSIAKSAPANATAGATFQYVITVANLGPDPAQDVTFTDALPAGTTFISVGQNTGPASTCSGPAVNTNGTVSCTTALLFNGQSAQFTITARVNSSVVAGTVLSNTATVASSGSTDTDTSNNSSNATTTVTVQNDVAVSKIGPATIVAGTDITYAISVTNNGPSDAQNVTFSDPTPASTTFVSLANPPGWSCTTPASGGSGTVSCSTATLAAGATANFTLVLHVASAALNGSSISNVITIPTADTNNGNNSATSTAVVSRTNDLSVTKSGPPTAAAGGSISYTIVASNNGPSDAFQVNLTDSTPANTTFTSIVAPAGWSCTTPTSGTAGAISCGALNFAAGAVATFTLNLAVSPSAPNGSTIANTAQINSTYTDPTPGNNQSTSNATVSTGADVSIVKTGPATATAGTMITWSIVVTNNGPADAQNVTVSDSTVTGVTTFAQHSAPAGWLCSPPPPNSIGTFTCTTPTLAAGASATISLSFYVNSAAPAGSSVVNTALASSATSDPNNANNSSTSTATVATSADLVATKSGPASAQAGAPISYTIGIINNGPSDALNATLSDVLPAGTKFVSITQTGGSVFTCTTPAAGASGTVSCSISSLAANGAFANFTLVVTNPASGTTYVNTDVASSTAPDPNTGNNSASVSTLLTPGLANISVTKTVASPNVLNGANQTYTITITNAGPANADNVVATDVISSSPASETFVSATPSQGTCDSTVKCTMGTIAPGASATIILVTKAGNTVGQATNTVTVTSSSADPDPTNNAATVSYNVVSPIPALSPLALLFTAFALALGGVVAMKSRG